MKQLLLMLVLLIGSFTNAQNFDFSCGPTAEQIAAMELRILTDERIQLLAYESSETTIISSKWVPEDGHVITIANSLKTILASDYGHRNFGKSETFDSLIEAVRKVVSRLDHIQTLATGDVKITHVYAYILDGYDEFLMTAGTIGYNQDGETNFGSSTYVIEDLEGTDLTDLYDKISGVVSRVQNEYDNPPLTLREKRLKTAKDEAISATTTTVLVTIEENAVFPADHFNLPNQKYDRVAFSDLSGTIPTLYTNHDSGKLVEDSTEDNFGYWVYGFGPNGDGGFIDNAGQYQAKIDKRVGFVMQIEAKSTPTVPLTVDRFDVNPDDNDGLEDIIRYTVGTTSSFITLSKLLYLSNQDDIDNIINVILPMSIPPGF